VKLLLAFHSSIEFNDTFYGNSYTVRVLSVGDVESRYTVLHLAGKEGKVYSVGCDEKGGIEDATNKRIELLELLVGKGRPPKSNRVVRLRLRTLY